MHARAETPWPDDGRIPTTSHMQSGLELTRWLISLSLAGMVLLLLLRGGQGALHRQFTVVPFFMAAAVVPLFSWLFRMVLLKGLPARSARSGKTALHAVASVFWVVGLWPVAPSRLLATAMVLSVGLTEAVLWFQPRKHRSRSSVHKWAAKSLNQETASGADSAEDSMAATWQLQTNPRVTEATLRTSDESGTSSLQGWQRIHFVPRQRTAALHLAFCPPLSNRPSVEFEPQGDHAAEVRMSDVQNYGVRAEVKLSSPAENALDVIVEYFVTSGASPDSTAKPDTVSGASRPNL